MREKAEKTGVRQEVPDDLLLSERVIDKGLPRKGWAFCMLGGQPPELVR
jgi:hypothetical protein